MIMVRENNDPPPEGPEYKHGLTPPMKDARRRRFRREPDLNVCLFCSYLACLTSCLAQLILSLCTA